MANHKFDIQTATSKKSRPTVIPMEHTRENVIPVSAIKTQYVLPVLIACVIIGSIPFVTIEVGLSLGWVKLIQMLLFCGAGFVYSFKIQRRDSHLLTGNKENRNASIQLSIFIFVALAPIYYFFRPDLILMAPGSGTAFLLPGIVKSSWLELKDYAAIEYGVWTTPVPDTKEKTFIFFGGLALKINFSIRANDRSKKTYRSHAPLDKSIGDFFNHFLLIQRNNNKLNIDLIDEDNTAFGWKFYQTEFWGLKKRQLDPEANLEEMNVKNHATIMVERVRLINESA